MMFSKKYKSLWSDTALHLKLTHQLIQRDIKPIQFGVWKKVLKMDYDKAIWLLLIRGCQMDDCGLDKYDYYHDMFILFCHELIMIEQFNDLVGDVKGIIKQLTYDVTFHCSQTS